jgi:hypothetical protein
VASPFLFADRPDDIARVREALDRAGYYGLGSSGVTDLLTLLSYEVTDHRWIVAYDSSRRRQQACR